MKTPLKRFHLLLLICLSGALSMSFYFLAGGPSRLVSSMGRYSMLIPDYLTETDDLNDEASLQYQNIFKELYIIVIDESAQEFKETFIELNDYDTTKSIQENYARAQMQSIEDNMATVDSKNRRSLATGCGNAIVYDIVGTQTDIEGAMGFTVAFIKGRVNVYMIMSWTFAKELPLYQADMDAMIVSFTEQSGMLETDLTMKHVLHSEDFSMDVPKNMHKDTSAPYSAFSYIDDESRMTCNVESEIKTTFTENSKKSKTFNAAKSLLDNYAATMRKKIIAQMSTTSDLTDLPSRPVNGLETRTFTMKAKPKGASTTYFYKIRFVEGKSKLYVITARIPANRLPDYEQELNDMVDSFREI